MTLKNGKTSCLVLKGEEGVKPVKITGGLAVRKAARDPTACVFVLSAVSFADCTN